MERLAERTGAGIDPAASEIKDRRTSDAVVTRPAAVRGPLGTPITLADLPAPETTRWVVRRKAEVLAAINGGLLTAAEACTRYRLSPEELELWQEAVDRAGVPGLRVTRIQLYRELDRRKLPATPASARHAPPGLVWQA
jgi:hypothetical protein